MAPLLEHLPSAHEALGSILSTTLKQVGWSKACNPSTFRAETEGSEVRGHGQLCSDFEANLGSRSCQKKRKGEKVVGSGRKEEEREGLGTGRRKERRKKDKENDERLSQSVQRL